ncbi:DUF1877 family protein [Streptomyces sp. NPDC085529]|uniref:DUF1877 family protein n=1 Tax=Streptomyces sp. NPDC085529 TaxID=3365729 RepID=UPI0037D90954
MSIYLHFRAVAESEIQDDHSWLAAFMSEAWDDDEAAYAAGIAYAINKGWHSVHDLYAAAEALPQDSMESWGLPIYGGRPVPHSADADPSDPPLMLLEPPGVAQAARFLTTVSFDELWNAVGAGIGASDRARQEHLEHHLALREFYALAAAAGHAVVKAVWA